MVSFAAKITPREIVRETEEPGRQGKGRDAIKGLTRRKLADSQRVREYTAKWRHLLINSSGDRAAVTVQPRHGS